MKAGFLFLAVALFLGVGAVVYCIWSAAQLPQSFSQSAIGWPLVFLFFGGLSVVALLSFGLWIWTLVDCLSKESSTGNTKLVWFLVILFLHILGSLLYIFVRVPQRQAEAAQSL